MKIGIVGYQGSGKSTLFHWLTGIAPDPSLAHTTQSAMAPIPEPRIDELCQVYQPKKVTQAALEIVDTPGLSRTHEGSAQKLAMIREAGALVIVVAGFGAADARADLRNFDDDLLIADLDIVSGRVERLRDQLKKPRPSKEKDQEELAFLEPVLAELEAGRPLHGYPLTPDQRKAIKSFQLFSEKPRLIIVNTADDEAQPERFAALAPEGAELFALSLTLQMDLAAMQPEERGAFCREMQVQPFDRDHLLRRIMHVSGQMLFFTAGEKEVRTWLIRQGGTALEAAAGVHTDLARGFIRAETMNVNDLVRLGSEREIKAAGLVRQEPKDYVIQDGDVINIKHNA
jgi:ribosome-binding ATPase YchF (GTP1/OBG family)